MGSYALDSAFAHFYAGFRDCLSQAVKDETLGNFAIILATRAFGGEPELLLSLNVKYRFYNQIFLYVHQKMSERREEGIG